jgi:hypothetical protein
LADPTITEDMYLINTVRGARKLVQAVDMTDLADSGELDIGYCPE